MDLKIKDVADLLNVSETTIRRWLSDGKIPAYRINHQYRFSRVEIENWVLRQKLSSSEEAEFNIQTISEEELSDTQNKGGTKQFSLYRALHKGRVLNDINGKSKEEVIRNTMSIMANDLSLDKDVLTDLLLDRENLQPTALNHGVAIPHTRDFLLDAHHDVVSVVFLKEPIPYGALDGKNVHTLFFLFACDDKRHLHLLAKIAHLTNYPRSCDFFQTCPKKEDLLDYVKNWEASILPR